MLNVRVLERLGRGSESRRILRERKTFAAMIRVFCGSQHRRGRLLCEQCSSLMSYAMGRLDRCPFAREKPPCVKCPIHCYKADRREEIRAVMRYAGPRMVWRHPWLALQHLLDGCRSRRRG